MNVIALLLHIYYPMIVVFSLYNEMDMCVTVHERTSVSVPRL